MRRDAYKLDNLQSTNAAQALIMKMDKAQLDDFDLMYGDTNATRIVPFFPLFPQDGRQADDAQVEAAAPRRSNVPESWLPGGLGHRRAVEAY